MATRPAAIALPPLAAPQPQPTFLGTPFASSSTQNPFEYPFAQPGPPSPVPGDARTSPTHPHTTSPVHPKLSLQAAPVPPTLLARRNSIAFARHVQTAAPEQSAANANATAARLAEVQALSKDQQHHDRRRGSFA